MVIFNSAIVSHRTLRLFSEKEKKVFETTNKGALYFPIVFPDYAKWNYYLKTKNIPGHGYLEKWWQLFMKVGEETMGNRAFDELMELNVFCLTKIPEVDSIWSGQVILTDKELVELRSIDCGASHQFYLVLVGAGVDLTVDLKYDPNYIGLNKQAAIHAALINDLYSLRKEIVQDCYRLNYVYVKMKNGNLTAQDSVNKVIIEIMEADSMAHVYGEKLKDGNYPNIFRYVDGIYAAMNGNHYWSTICRRYNQL